MKKANPTLTIEGFCNRLNQQLDKLEFSATAFHVALSSENLKESTLERVLDPENVIGLWYSKVAELEAWFEEEVNVWLAPTERITLPAGWVIQEARQFEQLLRRDLEDLRDACQDCREQAAEKTTACWKSLFKALSETPEEPHFRTVHVAAKRLKDDVQRMRSQIADFVGNTWNDDITPHIRS